jgi:MinD superfamily P-loop ATPase
MSGFQMAVASGKGGAGTTTFATALALSLGRRFAEAQFLDCDVAGPEAALFLKPTIERSTPIMVITPEVDPKLCTGCGECQAACQYNAVRVVVGEAKIHGELCNSCGCCRLVCPVDAITERGEPIGSVDTGSTENLVFYKGSMDTSRPLITELIRGLKAMARSDIPTVLDCGSGTTSEVIAAIRGSDYCILVADPTPFGLYDLRLMVRTVNEIGVPVGIVINKDDAACSDTEEYASGTGLPILMRIPFRKEIAQMGCRGVALTEIDEAWDPIFWEMYEKIVRAG